MKLYTNLSSLELKLDLEPIGFEDKDQDGQFKLSPASKTKIKDGQTKLLIAAIRLEISRQIDLVVRKIRNEFKSDNPDADQSKTEDTNKLAYTFATALQILALKPDVIAAIENILAEYQAKAKKQGTSVENPEYNALASLLKQLENLGKTENNPTLFAKQIEAVNTDLEMLGRPARQVLPFPAEIDKKVWEQQFLQAIAIRLATETKLAQE